MLRHIAVAAALVGAASFASAQTLYGISAGAVGTSIVTELVGPPGGACAYPTPVGLPPFATFVPFGCPTVGGLPIAGILGDVAHDLVTDMVWATDGPTVTGWYTPAGLPASSFPTPPPLGLLTGLGCNSAAGLLWMTDGVFVMATFLPAPGCAPPPIAVPPFPTLSPGPLTDIEWDPSSGTLFGCDALGFVTNMTPAGALGPFGIFPVPACAPALVPPLQGLAVDTATPSILGPPLTLLITDGITINKVAVPGAIAPPTFYFPVPCWPAAAPILKGLAFALHGVNFGMACSTTGAAVPAIGSAGNSTTPGVFTITLAGAPAGMLAWLLVDTVAQCPALAFKGCPLYAAPVFLFGPFPIPPGGAIALPAAIPPALPPGILVAAQWVCTQPGGGFALTSGLECTLGLP